jgi:hypothetical protein
MVFDAVRQPLEAELAEGPLGSVYAIEQVLPEPPDMERYREAQAEEARRREAARDEENRAKALRK